MIFLSIETCCHDHMCVSYSILCAMVVSSAYLGFPGLGLDESGSSGKTHPHVMSGGLKCEKKAQRM
jgi:hypothetical protein